MSNSVFKALFLEKVYNFSTNFSDTSKLIFYDENQKRLRHPGEFGIFREKLCKDFLRFFIPLKLEIDDGFVINSNNEISTQCDIVIYDKEKTPLIRSEEHQKFYPVETVVGVGEIKSILSYDDLKEALKKLSDLKRIRENIANPILMDSKRELRSYNPKMINEDQIFTFLICEKFDFDFCNIVDKFKDVYDGLDMVYWHNMILSIKNGLILYRDHTEKDNPPCPYPIRNGEKLKNFMFIEPESEIIHFTSFAQHINSLSSSHKTLYIDMFSYLGAYDGNYKFCEESSK